MEENKELLYFKMQLLQAEIKMNSMIAENKQCEIDKCDLTFQSGDFIDIIAEYEIHHNAFPL